ncbi:MAG: C4-type zinc ribbon domain-containing protein [Fimbriimonadaceae bacterium]
MPAGDLLKLWKLHQIDAAILEIRGKAAALDPGRAIQAQLDALAGELAIKGGEAKALSGELTDLELHQKQLADKISKIEKDLYGGKVVNPREVENLQKEIDSLRRQRAADDGRILELWELVPPAKAASEAIEKSIASKQADLAAHQKKVMAVKQQLEAEFKQQSAARPAAAAEVPRPLLDRYDSIRQKNAGTGMARINTKTSTCGICGMKLPTKTIESAKEDRLVTCESCHRILYYSESIL